MSAGDKVKLPYLQVVLKNKLAFNLPFADLRY